MTVNNLYIRSQNSNILTSDINVQIEKSKSIIGKGYIYIIKNTTSELGAYTSKEKALSVLDGIEDAIIHNCLTYHMPNDANVKVGDNNESL